MTTERRLTLIVLVEPQGHDAAEITVQGEARRSRAESWVSAATTIWVNGPTGRSEAVMRAGIQRAAVGIINQWQDEVP